MILSQDTFKEKFFADQNPYWKAYEGKSTSKSPFAQNMQMEEMEASWQLLESTVFGVCDGGTVTILTKHAPSSKDGLVVTVNWGNMPAIGGMHPGMQQSFGGGGIAGLQQIMGFAQDIVKQQIEPIIKGLQQSFEIERLKDKIQQLEEAEGPTTKDMVIEGITSRLPDLIDSFLGRRASAPAIGVLGSKPMPETEEESENAPLKGRTIDLNAVVNSAQVLQTVFPQYDVSVLLINLANYCQANPGQADMVIKMIMKG